MPVITYSSIPKLARKIRAELSEDEFKLLIKHLVRNNIAEFTEYKRDATASGTYAPISRVCLACGRPK